MDGLNLVLGANGHLGNNLVRLLLQKGKKVRAGVRNTGDHKPFKGLDCERVYAELTDRQSLSDAMKGVDTVYVAAAVYKSWAKNVRKEIIDVNIDGTRNIVDAAAAQGVGKTVYVSTTFALDHSRSPMDESGWNHDHSNPYNHSKTESEKLALDLAKQHGLWIVSILPSGMIGPNSFGHLTPTMEVLSKIIGNQLPVDPQFRFNFVDIRDVAETMIAASEKGRKGERYVLAQEEPITSTEVIEYARSLYPSVKTPKKPPYAVLYCAACVMEVVGKIARKKPLMLRSQVRFFRKTESRYDNSKAKSELGFDPRTQQDALKAAFEYLRDLKAN